MPHARHCIIVTPAQHPITCTQCEKSFPARAAVEQVHAPLLARAASGVGSGSETGCSRTQWAISGSLHFSSINDTSFHRCCDERNMTRCRDARDAGSSHSSRVRSPTSMWLRLFRQRHHMLLSHATDSARSGARFSRRCPTCQRRHPS